MAAVPTAPTVGKPCGRVPQVTQMEQLECGAACLAMICAYYGKWLPLEQVRRDCGVSRDGSKASKILKAARSYGLEASGFRCEAPALAEAEYPCIIFWGGTHFVVLRGFRKGKALVNDPARGEVEVEPAEFARKFAGVVLMFKPGPGFVPEGKPPSVASFVGRRVGNSMTDLAFLALGAALAGLLQLADPLMSQAFADKVLGNPVPGITVPFFALLTILTVLQFACALVNALYLLRAEGKLATVGSSSFLWHVLHMPVEFFSQRAPGDLVNRLALNTSVSATLVSQMTPIFINGLTMVFCLVLMVCYSPWLALFGLAATVIKAVVSHVISQKRLNSMRIKMRDGANLSTTTISGLSMIETLKTTGATQGFFQRWSGHQASFNDQQVALTKLELSWGLIPQVVTVFLDAFILVAGVWLIVHGQFTVGMLVAFQGVLGQFAAPLDAMIAAMQAYQEMRVSMERIDDVLNYPEDELCVEAGAGESANEDGDGGPRNGGEARGKVFGSLVFENVTFGYSRLEQPLVESFSLEVPQGGCVAIVGPSGCGKSTLVKLASGLCQPWSGRVLLGGTPLGAIARDRRCASVAMVDQDICLFGGATVAENIRLWDDTIPGYAVSAAAHQVGMHDVIMGRPGGYDRPLSANADDFSGGQLQRLEIARALAMEPTFILLDEATSALDAKTEAGVLHAIRQSDITTLMVTHRLSAIRDCDLIVVLDQGHIVQQGTHDELMAQGGPYVELVTLE